MVSNRMAIQVLLVEEDEGWTAQGLQYDISAHAETLEDVLYAFERAIVGHQAAARKVGVEPFEAMPSAPKKCWDLWKAGRRAEIEPDAAFRVDHGPSILPPQREIRFAQRA